MIVDPDRLVCGIATCFGTRSANGVYWTSTQWQQWLDLDAGLPLLVDHGPLINSRGVIATIGTARRFAVVDYPVDGLLVLCEVDHAEGFGDSVLLDLRSSLSIWSGRTVWGFSVGAHILDDLVLPYELSITSRPGFSDARILEVGPKALSLFDLLTEQRAEVTK